MQQPFSALATQIVDISVALNALRLYSEGDYKSGISQLIQILDLEPNNWQARLMLGACYYKTGEFAVAQRVFRFLYEKCPEADLKQKALEGLQASNAKLLKHTDLPPEFGCHIDLWQSQKFVSWLDDHLPHARPKAFSGWSARIYAR